MARPYWQTDHMKEASSVISALMDKAEITHWRFDGKSGYDGGNFLRMILPSTWPRPQKVSNL